MCGEKPVAMLTVKASRGSPPRVRGEELAFKLDHPQHGITPACAGRRRTRGPPASFSQDHPRVCGEKRLLRVSVDPYLGSPPRVRGEAIKKSSVCVMTRITPACAGRSMSCARATILTLDHPRVCGEKARSTLLVQNRLGSPPRVRGEALRAPALPVNRITPACAGRR